MREIIIVYPVKDIAIKLRHLFEQEGFYVSHICAQGSTALSISSELCDGIIVCAERLSDMSAGNLAQLVPLGIDVVALTKNGTDSIMSNLIYLSLPVDRVELISTIRMLASSFSSYSKRDKANSELISKAKHILMSSEHIPETQAHKLLQQRSMKTGRSLTDVAKEIISKNTA